jgi:hypothetical protein
MDIDTLGRIAAARCEEDGAFALASLLRSPPEVGF